MLDVTEGRASSSGSCPAVATMFVSSVNNGESIVAGGVYWVGMWVWHLCLSADHGLAHPTCCCPSWPLSNAMAASLSDNRSLSDKSNYVCRLRADHGPAQRAGFLPTL